MKYSKLLFLFTLSLLIGFSSCKKEEVSEMEDTIEEVKPEVTTNNPLVFNLAASASSAAGLDLGCFSVDFPFDLIVDGDVLSINSDQDFEDALATPAQAVDFGYPVNITYPDGTTDSVADGDELGEAFASCIPDIGWSNDGFPAFLICELNSCYQLVYPINLLDPSGTVYTANDESEFIDLIANNPELYFEFPISLTDTDGNTVTAADDDALFQLLADCGNIYNPGGVDTTWTGGGLFGCYDIVFPVDVVDIDGNTTTLNNEDEFFNALLSGDFQNFAYPLTLLGEDGQTVVVNSDEELADAFANCGIVVVGSVDLFSFLMYSDDFDGDCYTVNYPFDVKNEQTGDVTTVADKTQAEQLILNSNQWLTIELPVSVTVLATGTTVQIDESVDLVNIWVDCQ